VATRLGQPRRGGGGEINLNNMKSNIKDRKCLSFNMCDSGKLEYINLSDAIMMNSGTNSVWSTAYVNTVDNKMLEYQYTVSGNNLYIPLNNVNEEIKNPSSGGYMGGDKGGNKLEIIKKINNVITSGTSTTFYVGKIYDFFPVRLALESNAVVFCADKHEAANAYFNNVPFVYVLDDVQANKERTWFINEFWRTLNIYNNKIKKIINT